MVVYEKAPAKINLGLCVKDKRPDGFHNIVSLFQTVSIYDELIIDHQSDGGLSCDMPGVPLDETNLVLRAERAFCDHFDIDTRLHYTLTKQIPSGAGLGGGSSDAAAAIRGCAKFHDTGADYDTLQTIAENVGSDVPFLISGGTALVTGRGERITPILWPYDFRYVIVYPAIPISTAWAYSHVTKHDGVFTPCEAMFERLLMGEDVSDDEFCELIVNDFEIPVFDTHPELVKLKSHIEESGARRAVMSGSGSAVIGLYDSQDSADIAAAFLRDSYEDVFTAQPVTF